MGRDSSSARKIPMPEFIMKTAAGEHDNSFRRRKAFLRKKMVIRINERRAWQTNGRFFIIFYALRTIQSREILCQRRRSCTAILLRLDAHLVSEIWLQFLFSSKKKEFPWNCSAGTDLWDACKCGVVLSLKQENFYWLRHGWVTSLKVCWPFARKFSEAASK